MAAAQAQQQQAAQTHQKRSSITSTSGSVPKASPLSQAGGSFPTATTGAGTPPRQ
jgi:hypothetical protein